MKAMITQVTKDEMDLLMKHRSELRVEKPIGPDSPEAALRRWCIETALHSPSLGSTNCIVSNEHITSRAQAIYEWVINPHAAA